MSKHKYIVCVDFDGVIHGYQSGWRGVNVINDPPVPGALEWLLQMSSDERFEIHVYSSRSKEVGGIDAMKAWLHRHIWRELIEPTKRDMGLTDGEIFANKFIGRLQFPTQKPAASMTIDDRAFHFQGRFPDAESLLAFKPWTKIEKPSVRVFFNGQLIAHELLMSVTIKHPKRLGENQDTITVLVPIVQRHAGMGPEYVPAMGPAVEKDGSWEAAPLTITLVGDVRVERDEPDSSKIECDLFDTKKGE